MVTVEDGTGKGLSAKVTADNQLLVKSINRPELTDQAIKGFGFSIGSGPKVITNDTQNGILFVKNNEDADLIIQSLIAQIGNTTGGAITDDLIIEIFLNPTGGTLLTNGIVIDAVNKNVGSSNLLDPEIRTSSALGETITGALTVVTLILADEGRTEFPLSAVLPKGSSIAVAVTSKSGNTNQQLQILLDSFLASTTESTS